MSKTRAIPAVVGVILAAGAFGLAADLALSPSKTSVPGITFLSDDEAYRQAGLQAVIRYQAKGCPRTNPTPDKEVVTVTAGWGRAQKTMVVPVIRASGSRVLVGKVNARYPDSDTIVLRYRIPFCGIRGLPSPENTP